MCAITRTVRTGGGLGNQENDEGKELRTKMKAGGLGLRGRHRPVGRHAGEMKDFTYKTHEEAATV